MKFLPLFRLNLTHSYYTNGRCPDFQIISTTATQRLLKNQRSVLKTLPDGVQILTAVNEDNTPFIAFPETAVFTFHLYLQNQTFPLFTNLAEIAAQQAPLFTNQNQTTEGAQSLTLSSRKTLATETFVVTNPTTKDLFTLSGKPLAGQGKTDFALAGKDIPQNPSTYDEAAKRITINTKVALAGTSFTVTYLSQPQRPQNSFAEIEIQLPRQTQLNISGIQFEISFAAKQTRWCYYVIADSTDAQFRIEDKSESPLKFSEANRTDLNQNANIDDAVALSLANKYPNLQRYRFLSDDLIFCQQQARKSLQLRLDGNQVAGTLPNPPLTNLAMSTIDQNGVPQKEDTLFQIIKYFNQDLATGGI